MTKTLKNLSLSIFLIVAGLFVIVILSCENFQSTLAEKELAGKILEIKKMKAPGQFTRIHKNTLKFEGYITRSSYSEYLKNIDDDVKVLVINCLGGDTYSGIKMGMDIKKRELNVVVEGLAVSSGANYLFLAGKEKIIKNGVVGFHGNAQAFLQQAGGFETLKKEMKEKYKIGDNDFDTFKKEQQDVIRLEREFYKTLNIPQQLFDITQTDSKGLMSELNENFDFLFPSPATMNKFNIKNVSGKQNIPLAEAVGIKVIYF